LSINAQNGYRYLYPVKFPGTYIFVIILSLVSMVPKKLLISHLFIFRTLSILVALLFAGSYCSNGQHAKDASVTSVHTADTATIMRILKYAEELASVNPDSALLIVNKTIEDSRRQAFLYGIGFALTVQGRMLTTQGKYKEAEQTFMLSLPYLTFSQEGKKVLPVVISNLGNIYYYEGNYEKAIQYYLRSLNMIEKIPDLKIGYVYANMAGALSSMGRSKITVQYYLDKAEQIALKENDFRTLGQVYVNKGVNYIQTKAWDSSLYYLDKALVIGKEKGLFKIEHLALTNIGIVYLEQKAPEKALPYLYAAEDIKGDISAFHQNLVRISLGNTLMQLHRYQEAEPILLKQYRDAVAQHQKGNERETHYNLSKLYGGMNDFKKAYQHAWDYIQLNDTLAGDEIMNTINDMEVNYRTAEKEKALVQAQLKIVKQEKDIERKNRWNTIIICVILILILVFFTIWRAYQSRKKLLTEQLHNMQQQQQIERLKATIEGEEKERVRIARELHDGVGGLVAVVKMNVATMHESPYTPKGEMLYRDTIQLLDEMGADLRFTAHNMIPDALLYRNIAEAVTHFCNTIQRSKGLPIEVQIFGDTESIPESYRLGIYRIIQELVHNIVKHAAASSALVQLIMRNNILSITVEDDGTGFLPGIQQDGRGIGLENIKERMSSMNGTYTLDSHPETGTSVHLEFEVDQNKTSILPDKKL
jgi:signal transduction histidine kinase